MSLSTFWAHIQLGLSSEVTKASNRYREEMRRLAIMPQPSATPSSMTEQSATTASSNPVGQSAPSALISETASDEVPQPTASITSAVETSSSKSEINMSYFTAFFAALQILQELLPSIKALVVQAEGIFGASTGSSKLAYVEGLINTAFDKATTDLAVLTELKALAAPVISGIVSAANLKGGVAQLLEPSGAAVAAQPAAVTTGATAKA